jgi:TetR/AcrR family transcriptional regulator, transcriptional repressor for nem operon
MARPRVFDPEQALDDAMHLFWERGYTATSTTELTRRMGLNRGSLYHAFGDKRELFLAVLDRYEERGRQRVRELFARPGSAKDALRTMLFGVAHDCTGVDGRKGCLVSNTASEMAPHDAEIAARIERIYRSMERELARAIRRAQAEGEIGSGQDARTLALYLITAMQGLRVIGKTRRSEKQLKQVVALVLAGFEA